jgi:putative MATE family efflux protein
MLGAEGEVLDLSWKYLKIIWIFYVFRMLQLVLSSIFQGMGDSRTPLYIVGLSNIFHIIVAYSLIYGKFGMPDLGISGAAFAAGGTEALSAAVLMFALLRKKDISLSVPFSSREDIKRLIKLSTPVVGERVLTGSMQWTYHAIILQTTVAAYAAHQAGMNVEAFAFLPGIAFMQAATALVGRNLGANNVDAAKRSGYQTSHIAMILMGAFGITYFFLPQYWMRVFTSDPEVIANGITFCKIAAFLQIPLAMTLVLGGALRGAGETRWVMLITLIGAWGVRIPFALLAYWLGWGITWIWLAMNADWFVRAGLLYWRYRRRAWSGE